eukprot:scaffold76471_cov51-Phaeocystis_antarctica.AAC.2
MPNTTLSAPRHGGGRDGHVWLEDVVNNARLAKPTHVGSIVGGKQAGQGKPQSIGWKEGPHKACLPDSIGVDLRAPLGFHREKHEARIRQLRSEALPPWRGLASCPRALQAASLAAAGPRNHGRRSSRWLSGLLGGGRAVATAGTECDRRYRHSDRRPDARVPRDIHEQ